jgi:hypothetical protein
MKDGKFYAKSNPTAKASREFTCEVAVGRNIFCSYVGSLVLKHVFALLSQFSMSINAKRDCGLSTETASWDPIRLGTELRQCEVP